MKIGSVTKLGKGNTETSKKIGDYAILTNCEVIAIFPINGQF